MKIPSRFLFFALVFTLAGAANVDCRAAGKMIQSINTPQLFKALGLPTTYSVTLSSFRDLRKSRNGDLAFLPCARYEFPKSRNLSHISIAVYPRVERVTTIRCICLTRQVQKMFDSRPKDIGDGSFLCLVTNGEGFFRFARKNVYVDAQWKGSYRDAVRFARRLDNLLANSNTICPKGNSVPIPKIRLSDVPNRDKPYLNTDSRYVSQKFEVEGTRVLAYSSAGYKMASSGITQYEIRKDKNGHETIHGGFLAWGPPALSFVTEGNVAFVLHPKTGK